jgi:cation diffusion facilitator family transporter
MHVHNLKHWKHSHQFYIDDGQGERNIRRVIILTVSMMGVEIAAGMIFGSMALLADGWHMGTHAMALGITAFAYYYTRRNATNPRYSFGTGKVGVLGGFTSAVILAMVAFLMAVESIGRLLDPVTIRFDEAIGVAVVGLVVNIISAWMLRDKHDHGHGHHGDHHSDDHSNHQDHNLYAAYLHVIADALTSFLAIIALSAGKMAGWVWMDPAMGIVGALLITRWSWGLLKDTGKILLDSSVSRDTIDKIQTVIESDADNRVSDIHVWPLGSNHFAAIISIVTHYPKTALHYKSLLSEFSQLHHITVEVNEMPGESCMEAMDANV